MIKTTNTVLPKTLFPFIWHFLKEYKMIVYMVVFLSIIAGFWGPLNSVLIKQLIDLLPSANGEGGGNFAYPLNGEIFDENVIVMLVRAGDHWVIVGGSGTAGSGGGPGFTFDCETGDFVVL